MIDLAESLTSIYDQIQPYLAKTVLIHSDGIDKYVDLIAANTGLREDAAKIMITMLLSYPVSFIHALIKNPTLKKITSILFGVIILQFCFQEAWIHAVIQSFVCYFIMLVAPSKIEPYLVFVFTMLYMSICMIYSLATDYMGWACDSTVYQMILVIKFSSLGFDLYDGTYDLKHADTIIKTSQNPKEKHTYEVRTHTRITSVPSPLDFFAYAFHFAGLLGGPTIFYREYLEVVNNVTFPENKIPNRTWPTLKCIIVGFLLFGLWGGFTSLFPVDYLISEGFKNTPFWKQCCIVTITGITVSFKYMATWKIGEGICIANGYGYKIVKDKPTWDGVANINVIQFYQSQDMGEATRNWNLRTQRWLSRYVYQRTGNSLFCVYLISAFWHGFYPGYYCSFLSLGFCQFVNRYTYSRLYLRVKDNYYTEKIYSILSNILCMFYGTYCVNAHFLMSVKYVMTYWKALHFIPHIAAFVALLILMCIPPVKVNKKEKKE